MLRVLLWRSTGSPANGEPLPFTPLRRALGEEGLDLSQGDQTCVEDCPVCCEPILVHYTVDDDGQLDTVAVARENG